MYIRSVSEAIAHIEEDQQKKGIVYRDLLDQFLAECDQQRVVDGTPPDQSFNTFLSWVRTTTGQEPVKMWCAASTRAEGFAHFGILFILTKVRPMRGFHAYSTEDYIVETKQHLVHLGESDMGLNYDQMQTLAGLWKTYLNEDLDHSVVPAAIPDAAMEQAVRAALNRMIDYRPNIFADMVKEEAAKIGYTPSFKRGDALSAGRSFLD